MNGLELMIQALFMQKKVNTIKAAQFLEEHGIPYELALVALVGSNKAGNYGLKIGVTRYGTRD